MKLIALLVFCVSVCTSVAWGSATDCESLLLKTSRLVRNYSLVPVLPAGVHAARVSMDAVDEELDRLTRLDRHEYLQVEILDENALPLLATPVLRGDRHTIKEELLMDSVLAILLRARELGLSISALTVRHSHPRGFLPIYSEADKNVSMGLKYLLEWMDMPDVALNMRLLYYPGLEARAKEFTIPGAFRHSDKNYRVRRIPRDVVLTWNWPRLFKHKQKSAHFQKIYNAILTPKSVL